MGREPNVEEEQWGTVGDDGRKASGPSGTPGASGKAVETRSIEIQGNTTPGISKTGLKGRSAVKMGLNISYGVPGTGGSGAGEVEITR